MILSKFILSICFLLTYTSSLSQLRDCLGSNVHEIENILKKDSRSLDIGYHKNDDNSEYLFANINRDRYLYAIMYFYDDMICTKAVILFRKRQKIDLTNFIKDLEDFCVYKGNSKWIDYEYDTIYMLDMDSEKFNVIHIEKGTK